jgi:hypothetical protein
MTRAIRAVAMLVAASLAPLTLTAQSWRTLEAARQRHAEDTLRVRVTFAAGTFKVGSAPHGSLYDVRLRWDADRLAPVQRYDVATGTLEIGINTPKKEDGSNPWRTAFLGMSSSHDEPSTLTLGVSRDVPLDLYLRSGATESNFDLSDLSLSRLRVETGASETHLDFRTPNPIPLNELDVNSGAASVTVSNLGNSNAQNVRVHTGVGAVDLDFSGALSRDMNVNLDVVLGAVTLTVPRDFGLRVRMSKVLAGFQAPDMVEHDGVYTSGNWANAGHKITVDANASFGNVEVVWSEK